MGPRKIKKSVSYEKKISIGPEIAKAHVGASYLKHKFGRKSELNDKNEIF